MQYDGTDFCGSQAQPGVRTVQGTLTEAIGEIMGQQVRLLFASRTDRGVHATCNVAVFRARELPLAVEKLPDVLNDRLPADLVIVAAREVPLGFHPRYFSHRRDYVYRLYRGRRPDIRYTRFCAHFPRPLDVPTMRLAAGLFLGEHDFAGFAVKDRELKDPVCTVYRCEVVARRKLLEVRVSANRFLRRMVCLLVGALVDVGTGRLPLNVISDALAGKAHPPFTNMPGHGLTLTGVHYPEHLLYDDFASAADYDDTGTEDE